MFRIIKEIIVCINVRNNTWDNITSLLPVARGPTANSQRWSASDVRGGISAKKVIRHKTSQQWGGRGVRHALQGRAWVSTTVNFCLQQHYSGYWLIWLWLRQLYTRHTCCLNLDHFFTVEQRISYITIYSILLSWIWALLIIFLYTFILKDRQGRCGQV